MPSRREILLTIFKFFDLVVMAFSFGLASFAVYLDHQNISLQAFLVVRVEIQNFIVFLAILFCWHYVFSFFGLYNSKRLPTPKSKESFDVLKATSVATCIISIMAFLLNIEVINLTFIAVFWTTNCAVLILSRLLLRFSLKQLRLRGRNLRDTLIVGTNQRAIKIAKELEEKKELGYHILGFVDEQWIGTSGSIRNRYHIVSDFSGFADFLKNNVVDEVLIWYSGEITL